LQLHIVGGFLGSGKTTAIIAAAKYLISQGKKVGVVTNDQGKYLVDTSFFQSSAIPTVEVTNGCFCCNYENLQEKIEQLAENEKPDVVFAESVGSCSDLVATVVKPLLELVESKTHPTSFSVFTDGQLLLAFLSGEELPFSDNVLYIFEKQIEEAELLIINKIDLLNAAEVEQVFTLAQKAFPSKEIRLQNSLSLNDVFGWYQQIDNYSKISSLRTIEIDYELYGKGESELAWLDQEIRIQSTDTKISELSIEIIRSIHEAIKTLNAPIGHLKFFVSTPLSQLKISIPTIEQSGWNSGLSQLSGNQLSLLINARVQISPKSLKQIVDGAIMRVANKPGVIIEVLRVDSFRPGIPNPTHRFTG